MRTRRVRRPDQSSATHEITALVVDASLKIHRQLGQRG